MCEAVTTYNAQVHLHHVIWRETFCNEVRGSNVIFSHLFQMP